MLGYLVCEDIWLMQYSRFRRRVYHPLMTLYALKFMLCRECENPVLTGKVSLYDRLPILRGGEQGAALPTPDPQAPPGRGSGARVRCLCEVWILRHKVGA